MSPPSPNERSRLPTTASFSSGRRSASYATPQSVRPTSYSSLGDALGSARSSTYPHEFPSGSSAASNSVPPHAATESRYHYYPSGMTSAYEYPPYQASSYDTSQYSHTALPPMRSPSPIAHPPPPPPTSHYNPPPSTTYAAPYAQAYNPISASSQQWADDEWGSGSHTFSPDPSQAVFVAGRSDLSASPQADPRAYMTQQYSSAPVNSRSDPQSHTSSPLHKSKTRDRDAPTTDSGPRSDILDPALDFTKLLETYRHMLAGVNSAQTLQGRSRSVDAIDGLIRSATSGMQMLNAASVSRASISERRPSGDSVVSTELGSTPSDVGQKRSNEGGGAEGQTCLGCGATSTPEWRRGPLGPRTLCNACGLVYAKLIKKRSRDHGTGSRSGANSTHLHDAPASVLELEEEQSFASPGEVGSDDELSYGSHDPL